MDNKIQKNNFTNNLKNKVFKGFTLIELLVVISIIGILATLVVANLNEARARARDSRRKQGLDQLKKALQLYYNDYKIFPADSSGRYLRFCSADGLSEGAENCQTGFLFSVSGTVYMSSLPEYQYRRLTTDSYILKVILDNKSDPDLLTSQARCPGVTYAATEYAVCP